MTAHHSNVEFAINSDSPNGSRGIAWRDRPFQTLQSASLILGLSTATIYRMAGEGRIQLKRLGGRTLVETSAIIRLVDTAEDWTPSTRTVKAKQAQLAKMQNGAS